MTRRLPSSRCRNAPADIKRKLRQEAFFGCCMCGNPLNENAHIIEYSVSKQFPLEDMLALCPNCHAEADLGHIPKYVLRDVKQMPFNKNSRYIKRRFVVTGQDLVVNTGSSKFVNVERIFVVDDFDLVSINRDHGMYLSLNVNLFDKFNRLVAIVFNNYWMVDRRYLWDIEYRPQHLTIRNGPGDITLDLQIKNEEISVTGNLYYNGFLIPIKPAAMNIGGALIKGMTMVGGRCAIDIHTR